MTLKQFGICFSAQIQKSDTHEKTCLELESKRENVLVRSESEEGLWSDLTRTLHGIQSGEKITKKQGKSKESLISHEHDSDGCQVTYGGKTLMRRLKKKFNKLMSNAE